MVVVVVLLLQPWSQWYVRRLHSEVGVGPVGHHAPPGNTHHTMAQRVERVGVCVCDVLRFAKPAFVVFGITVHRWDTGATLGVMLCGT